MKLKRFTLIVILLLGISSGLMAQQSFVPDLSDVGNSKVWRLINREITVDEAVSIGSANGDGLLYLNDFEFSNGRIDLDIRGQNNPGRSFVGLAFHGVDKNTFDAVYFRPFNFQNQERSSHSVQYVSMPGYDWSRLRQEHPGMYENTVTPVPDPEDWFHATIVISYPDVKVYVNNAEKASLEVKQISTAKKGWVGFWVGNYSDGSFRNLKITNAK